MVLELMRFDCTGGLLGKMKEHGRAVDTPEHEWRNWVISTEDRNGLERTGRQ